MDSTINQILLGFLPKPVGRILEDILPYSDTPPKSVRKFSMREAPFFHGDYPPAKIPQLPGGGIDYEQITMLAALPSKERENEEEQEFLRMTGAWLAAGGKIKEGVDIANALLAGAEVALGGKVISSLIWGEIDLSRLNQGIRAYSGPRGQAYLIRDLAIATGKFKLDAQRFILFKAGASSSERRVFLRQLGWQISQIDWRRAVYFALLFERREFLEKYKSESGYDQFALDFYQGDSKKAWAVASSLLSADEFAALEWGKEKFTNVTATRGVVVDLIYSVYDEVISILHPNLNPGFDTADPMAPYVKVRMFEDALKLVNQEQSDRLRSAVSFMSNSKIVEIFRKAYDDFEYEFIDRLIPAYANLLSEVSVNDAGVFMKTAFENASKQYHVLHQSRFYMDFYLLRIAEKLGTLNADVMAAWKASLHFTGGLIHDWAGIVMSFENDLDLGWSDSSVNKEISQVAGSVNLITGIRRSAAEARGVKLEVGKLQIDVPPLPPNMRAAFFRIANELIINGIKNSDKRRADRYVRVRFEIENSILRIFFEDNGVGIPDEKREDIWKEGVRLSPELADGDGLGLPNIRSLATIYGWKVVIVKSTPGVGSVFVLEMDTAKWENNTPSDPPESQKGPAQAEGGTPPPALAGSPPSGKQAKSVSALSPAEQACLTDAAAKAQFPQGGNTGEFAPFAAQIEKSGITVFAQ